MSSSRRNSQIFVTRLPTEVDEQQLEDLFKQFGSIRNVTLKKGYGFVVRIILL
jgi:RNA recognition motif-containing protein